MKLASQEGLAAGNTLQEKLDALAEAGYEGIEFWGGGLAERTDEIRRACKDHPVQPAAICAGFQGCPLDADKRERDKASADICRLLELAGELNMAGLIVVPVFGSPRIPDLSPLASAVQLEMDLLLKLCEDWAHAAEKAGTAVLLEPLNRYETHLLKTLQDAAGICEKIGSPHIKIIADFFHMSIEEASMPHAIEKAAKHIAHVHLADSNRLLPGLGHTDFKSGFNALKNIGYTGYMSLECGNPNTDKMQGLKTSAQFMKQQMMP